MDELHAGEVGWLSASIRAVADARVGDTITLKGKQGALQALPGEIRPACLVYTRTTFSVLHRSAMARDTITLKGKQGALQALPGEIRPGFQVVLVF